MPEPLVTRALALLGAIERGEVTVTRKVHGRTAYYTTPIGDKLVVDTTVAGGWDRLWSITFDGDGRGVDAFDQEELLAYRPPREVIDRVYGLRGDG